MDKLSYYLPCVWTFCACIGFSLLFNIHGAGMFICAGGGALGWLCYLLTGPLVHSDIIQSFFAALVISAWSELMARLRKCPVTSYLLVALFPLVPGGGIYYTMEYAMMGETSQFLSSLLHTLSLAGALATGVLLVSSLMRLFIIYQEKRRARQEGFYGKL
ncbi:threonine/serine exporter family protein [uncultured Flavonifractor sp.]|uniref:threonine/serine exporter family protein n=1 Tax=uncultured Flavonifractor sp. TaxID=1193534 RepID=UPI00262F3B38|nr:threonine/serine exporter family protein [uncultured Flavonifractor sp.]